MTNGDHTAQRADQRRIDASLLQPEELDTEPLRFSHMTEGCDNPGAGVNNMGMTGCRSGARSVGSTNTADLSASKFFAFV